MARDFYETLGVKRDASEKEIRQAYRRLARQFHPDVNPNDPDAEARFKEINAAHEVLGDPEKRQAYDKYGDQWMHADQIEEMRRQQGAAGGFRSGGFRTSGFGDRAHSQTFEFGDIEDLFGGGGAGPQGGGGMFDSLFRRGGSRGPSRRRGRDAEHSVRVSLAEAYRGATRTLEVRGAEEQCRICGGAGQLAGATCHVCRGTGSAAPLRRIEVTIPAGVTDGQRIRLAGRGEPGANGGAAGDLFLRVQVDPHPTFERRGDDLHVDVDVPVEDAALGGEVRVPTLKGSHLALRVPAGTQGGRVFRLAGQGMPRAGGGYGDLLARVRLVLPDPMTDAHRDLFEQLRALEDGMPEADGEAETRTETGAGTGATS